MTEVTLTLPEAIVREAEAAGLLRPEALAEVLREEIRRRRLVAPDTEHAYSVEQMAQAWQAIGQPITADDAALYVDPDDYPLF